jgi:nucleotide-binding universal stress UspA family protein
MDERPTIVVGVGGADGARAAIGNALDDAARRGARVRAVSVFEEPQYWAVAYGMSAHAPLHARVGDGGPPARRAPEGEPAFPVRESGRPATS